ncbi:MAG: extracellular solute-binding protein [Candidatus Pacebacteria bacterium]|nr:extracellular solute-binding protein [Candidatus Paceibacterota bacterium]MBP9818920.1 extracellular solute-binding protein [Candidatus Paceibacterota bacterium]
MKNVSTFQIVFLAVFILIAIVGVAVFAGFGGSNRVAVPKATIWGTVPSYYINEMVRNINIRSTVIEVSYIEKDPETFQAEFVNALAEGVGPDAVLLADDLLYSQKNKLQPIPFTVFLERDYRSTFIDSASIFISKDGILGVPLSIDPMVMYYNKNILARNAISRPPKSWKEMIQIAPAIIQRTDTSTIVQALVPFGEYSNVKNAKEILATLFFQTGNSITEQNLTTGEVYSVIDRDLDTRNQDDVQGGTLGTASNGASGDTQGGTAATESVLDFYTSFANPSKSIYSWNRSLPNSENAFLSGDLTFYFGYASEIQSLRDKNPNLNFDVAQIPEEVNGTPNVYGKMTAFAIVKNSKNFAGALGVISKLTEKSSIELWRDVYNLPPVRRDLLAEPAKDAYMTVFYRSAIQSKSWYDPSPAESDAVFRDMIESITSGREKMSNAVGDAKLKLDRLLKTK